MLTPAGMCPENLWYFLRKRGGHKYAREQDLFSVLLFSSFAGALSRRIRASRLDGGWWGTSDCLGVRRWSMSTLALRKKAKITVCAVPDFC